MSNTFRSLKLLPREKIQTMGAEHLSISELCAAILGVGTQKQSVLSIGEKTAEILTKNVHTNPTPHLQFLGTAQSTRILAALELGRRMSLHIFEPIITPEIALQHAHELRNAKKEIMIGLYLDTRSRIIQKEILAVGGLNQAAIVPRDLLLPLRNHPEVESILLLHNHPSGDPAPSQDDLKFTQRIQEMCALLGIQLQDHIIAAQERWSSLRQLGHLS